MTEFWRDGFWRLSVNGVLHWVAGHSVNRVSTGRRSLTGAVVSPLAAEGITQARETDEQRAFRLLCPKCGEPVWFVRPEHGGCFFCDDLGGDWPPHLPCFPRQEGFRHGPSAPPLAQPAQTATWKADKAQATVLEVWPLASGSVLVMMRLNAERLFLPLIGHQSDDWKRGGGKLDYGRRAGCFIFTPSGRPKESKAVFGPIFDCRNLTVWETGDGSSADLLALGRDLGIRRLEHYPGHGLLGYVAPRWREALRAYMPAILDGNDEALHEAIDLIELPAKGLIGQERVLIRLRRELRRAPDKDAHDQIWEDILEHFRV